MADKIKATKEMRKYIAELNQESNDWYQDKNFYSQEVEKLKKDIGTATIGFGKAIIIMTERLDIAQKKLDDLNRRAPNTSSLFIQKFGIDQFQVDFISK